MNKQLFRKSMTSFAVAGTMLFSAVAPAFAVDSEQKNPLQPKFNKEVVVQDADTYQPAATFEFKVEGVDPNPKESRDGMKVSSGTGTGTITAKAVTTNPAEHGSQTYPSAFDLSNLEFKQPGIYKYEVKETKGTNTDMTYDEATRYLYVFVKREDGVLKVYDSKLVKADDDTDKNATFTNKYGVGDKKFNDLKITKKVTGAMGDTQKDWNFKLTITSGSGRSTYVVKKGNGELAPLTSDKTYTFTLKSDESITVENLSTTDTYKVTEDEAKQDKYDTTGEVKDAKHMEAKNVEVEIINNRDAVTPTGIMMMYGPYALMVALAGALGLFVAKKHRAEEE